MSTRHSSLHRAALVGAALTVLAACGGGVTETTPPPPGGGTDTTGTNPPPGTVQRASITVQVGFDPEDAAMAQTAGVSLTGLTVRLQRSGSTDAPKTATTDANGRVTFEQLLQGTYVATVERTLTTTELNRLPVSERDASVLAGGGQVTLAPPNNRTITISVVGARRGSLVISEQFSYINSNNPVYNWGHYLEVYNNSDTTIFLDGIVLFRTTRFMHTASSASCSHHAPFREDPERIWAITTFQFPGSGREFPILPGEGKVIAQDALDHSAAAGVPSFEDLSRAHFEMIGNEADINNSVARDMVNGFGVNISNYLGRGNRFEGWNSWGLALPSAVDDMIVDTLRAETSPNPANPPAKTPMAGIRREHVLDVFSTTLTPARRAFLNSINFGAQDCSQWLAPVFEREPAPLYYEHDTPAIRRKSLGRTADGREILQRTRTSARDLERAQPLRRSLNKP